ncbi:MAG TPA: DUF4446 family protein [Candidatus Saccharimonadales bacterium]|nr:DUF4446 family protein [Candidatus Saccharimonadales bacterium]
MLTVLAFIIVLISLIWMSLLTIFFWSLSSHYNNLIKATNKKTLQTALDSLLVDVSTTKKDIEMLRNTCDTITNEGKLHIQKVGLLRFNPFKDTGGDQSFILALVNGEESGVVISGLYSRTGTRWYAKKVSRGQGVEHTLSEEEKKALKEAKSIN